VNVLLEEEGRLGITGDLFGPGATTVAAMVRRVADWFRHRPLAADGLFAAALTLVEVVIRLLPPPDTGGQWLPAAVGWAALCAAPVALRRVRPWLAVGAAVATLVVTAAAHHTTVTHALSLLVLTYTMAANCAILPAVAAAVALWAPETLVPFVPGPGDAIRHPLSPLDAILSSLLTGGVCFFIGRTVHARRTSTLALRERARAAEESQRSLAEQAVADERRRIARELHDVVAHHVSVMGVLATGARRVLRRDPDSADEALGTIEDTSRTTLREMRRLLDVLRTEAEPAADLTPQPGLAGIEALVEQVREAGMPVTLRVDGVPGSLDPGVALTIFRIVQEALTNALKHAGMSATAQVRLSFGALWLIVEVFDTGLGPVPASGRLGHGLVGMRERVALYGGTLRTGPRPGGGFRVYAKIPMEQLSAPTGEGAA
jgi:signal transduction histidine kinase